MILPGFLTRNLRLKLLAAGLALITWVSVVYSGNPPESRTVMVHVPQDPASVPRNFLLLHSIPDLSVRVAGLRDRIEGLTPGAALAVSVQWGAVKSPGTQQLPIIVKVLDSDIRLVDAPTTVVASVDLVGTVSQRSTAVVPALTGSAPVGHELGGISVQPAAVLISGVATQLGGLDSVSTEPVPLTGLTESHTFSVKVLLPQGVTAVPGYVAVTVTVVQLPSTASPAPQNPPPSSSPSP